MSDPPDNPPPDEIRKATRRWAQSARDSLFIQSARKRLGLTQAEMAAALGVRRLAIIHYETGERRVPRAVVLAIKYLELQQARKS